MARFPTSPSSVQNAPRDASGRRGGRSIPSLDGLRAVSILLVIAAHASGSAGAPAALRRAMNVIDFGNLGVRVFFVISGFLITGLLLKEQRTTGRISVPRFYLRRTFRIFPPFYAFISALAIATAVGWIAVPHDDLVHALTYTVNYHHTSWYVGHAWSLSVEEQFYLLWPAVLVLCGVRRATRVAVGFMLVVPAIRLAYYLWVPSTAPTIGWRFETVGDAIAIGCVLALLRDALWAQPLYRRLLTSRWIALAPLAIVLSSITDGHPRVMYPIGIPMRNVAVAILVDWSVRFPAGTIGRVLNSAAMRYIGVLSYSLYVWQEPFLIANGRHVVDRFPLNIAAATACALASYYAIERPALRARAYVERFLDARRQRAAGSLLDPLPAQQSASIVNSES